jgi:hypothetical protein
MSSTPNALEAAKKALAGANNFEKSVDKQSGTTAKPAPKPAAARADYSHAREARKAPGEFMGVKSDQGPELNSALESHEQAKAALNQ